MYYVHPMAREMESSCVQAEEIMYVDLPKS